MFSLRELRLTGRKKRVAAFFDGRNARGAARKVFGANQYANFNPKALARRVCESRGWQLGSVSFYIGIPAEGRAVFGETKGDWERRLLVWRRQGVRIITRELSSQNREKGIDVRLALDVTREFENQAYDIALIFSQDQDFQELIRELNQLDARAPRRILSACAYPSQPTEKHNRGIDNVDIQIPVPKEFYERSLEGKFGRLRTKRQSYLQRQLRHWSPSGMLIGSYLAIALLTFVTISIPDKDNRWPTDANGISSQLFTLVANSASALVWPVYWPSQLQARPLQIEQASNAAPLPEQDLPAAAKPERLSEFAKEKP